MADSNSKVASLVREARDELKKGNRDEAFLLLKKALSMDPGSSSAVTEVILAIEKEDAQEKAREARASAPPAPPAAERAVERPKVAAASQDAVTESSGNLPIETAKPKPATGNPEIERAQPKPAPGNLPIENAKLRTASGDPDIERAQPTPASGNPEIESAKLRTATGNLPIESAKLRTASRDPEIEPVRSKAAPSNDRTEPARRRISQDSLEPEPVRPRTVTESRSAETPRAKVATEGIREDRERPKPAAAGQDIERPIPVVGGATERPRISASSQEALPERQKAAAAGQRTESVRPRISQDSMQIESLRPKAAPESPTREPEGTRVEKRRSRESLDSVLVTPPVRSQGSRREPEEQDAVVIPEVKPRQAPVATGMQPARPVAAGSPAVRKAESHDKPGIATSSITEAKPKDAVKPAGSSARSSFRQHVIPGDDAAPPPARKAEAEAPVSERKSVPVQQNLQSLFDGADRALASGDEAGAMNLLRKAKELAPDDPDVKIRLLTLQRRIKAENLVRVGMRKLESGSAAEALAAATEAFTLMPMVPGLEELVAKLEKHPAGKGAAAADVKQETRRASASTERQPAARTKPQADGADEYVRKVREQIQLSALPNAAAIAAEGLARHPGNELLMTFVDKFQRMNLLKD